MLGLNPGFKPKFLRMYANAFEVIRAALDSYDRDVKGEKFPSESECYIEGSSQFGNGNNTAREKRFRLEAIG